MVSVNRKTKDHISTVSNQTSSNNTQPKLPGKTYVALSLIYFKNLLFSIVVRSIVLRVLCYILMGILHQLRVT